MSWRLLIILMEALGYGRGNQDYLVNRVIPEKDNGIPGEGTLFAGWLSDVLANQRGRKCRWAGWRQEVATPQANPSPGVRRDLAILSLSAGRTGTV